jgi:hypothetical protein
MTEIRWRKARASAEQTDCVELAHTLDAVRDSKCPDGPTLRLPLSPFLAAVRDGALHR